MTCSGSSQTQGTTKQHEIRACKRKNCKYCNKINLTGRHYCPMTKSTHTTIRKANCKSNDLIYCLTCKSCDKMYAGQTKRGLRYRLCEHFRNVTQNNTTVHSDGRYGNERGHHGIAAINTYVLQFAKRHQDSDKALAIRLQLDQSWISRLRTQIPDGLKPSKN